MIFERHPSFFRSLKAVRQPKRLDAIEKALATLIGCFDNRTPPPAGLGLKQLKANIWEVRSTLRDRIIFSWIKNSIRFLLVGSHDEIRRFLKNR
ncbi:MAG: hypothetical protein HY401_09200 [Elusimicrobia bacterium]|nr:hypothetical protein [Elusimicrobiota bacterium]